MFGMVELHLCIIGFPLSDVGMEELVGRYLLRDSLMYMCIMGPNFQEPLDDVEAKVTDELYEDDTTLKEIDGDSDVVGGCDGDEDES